ncbi:hypothetical protein MNBD_GAMMA07-1639 [hydrothermal vent metagenome]|uniref:Uncharacterized protein n=1 Tax=hydrothermal vent metagenome TaxID=652676 RepID=A0A3B0WZF2_9ZZZZ
MLKNVVKRIIISILCYILAFSSTVNAAQNSFLSIDVLAPEISQPEYIDTVIKDTDHTVTVNVTDNAVIKQVTLYYRLMGDEKFIPLPMNIIENTHNYQVNIAAKNIKNTDMEYYIQAMDSSENESFHGHSFSPLSVTLIADAPIEPYISNELASNTLISEESNIFTNKWFWIGVGVLVVGAAATGGGSEPPATTTSLTIDAGELIIP